MFARISTVHVPPSNVAEAFDLLAESMPDLGHMEELLSYFEHTYVQGRRRRGRRNNLMDPPLFAFDSWKQLHAASDGI